MTLNRLEASQVGLVLEWDPETGLSGLSLTSGGRGGRDRAYGQLQALQSFLAGSGGFHWIDLELTERHRSVCGVQAMALVWRAQWTPASGVTVLADAVKAALGVETREVEE